MSETDPPNGDNSAFKKERAEMIAMLTFQRKEQERLYDTAGRIEALCSGIDRLRADLPGLITKAAAAAITAGLASVVQHTAAEANRALRPVVEKIEAVEVQVAQAEQHIKTLTRRLVRDIAGGTVAFVVLLTGLAWGTGALGTARDRSRIAELSSQRLNLQQEIADLGAQKSALVEDVAALQKSQEFLITRGARAQIASCGPKLRLCIKIDKNAPPSEVGSADYRIILGY